MCFVCLNVDEVLHAVIMGIFFTSTFVSEKWLIVVLIVSRK